jgi:hypothetical protein
MPVGAVSPVSLFMDASSWNCFDPKASRRAAVTQTDSRLAAVTRTDSRLAVGWFALLGPQYT